MKASKIQEQLSRIPLLLKLLYYDYLGDEGQEVRNIPYGEEKRQYYRVYKGNNPKLPLIFFIHGGGWWHGSPQFSSAVGKFFAKRGYTTVLPAYRLVPKARYPQQIEDIVTAFKEVLKNETLAYKGIIVMGFSAGGELGARLVFDQSLQSLHGYSESCFKGFVSFAGVLDFKTCQSAYTKLLIKNYLPQGYKIEEVNPLRLVSSRSFPVLCLHGKRDRLIERENALNFIQRVKEVGGKGEVILLEGYHHSDILRLVIGKGMRETAFIWKFIEDKV